MAIWTRILINALKRFETSPFASDYYSSCESILKQLTSSARISAVPYYQLCQAAHILHPHLQHPLQEQPIGFAGAASEAPWLTKLSPIATGARCSGRIRLRMFDGRTFIDRILENFGQQSARLRSERRDIGRDSLRRRPYTSKMIPRTQPATIRMARTIKIATYTTIYLQSLTIIPHHCICLASYRKCISNSLFCSSRPTSRVW